MIAPTLEQSRERLLEPLQGRGVSLWRTPGNIGDDLIAAGTKQLWLDAGVYEVEDDVIVISGGGGWCDYWKPYAVSLTLQAQLTGRDVIVYPSTFDVRSPLARGWLASHYHRLEDRPVKIFVREAMSAQNVRYFYQLAELAHCPSFFFDYTPYQRPGRGTLTAYRNDPEAAGCVIDPGNHDLSLACRDLHSWLTAIANAEIVKTDRAHVMIAAALLGKTVKVRPNAYFKVQSLYETWLTDYDVEFTA